MFNNGIKTIEGAVSQFESLKVTLEKGIEQCGQKQAENKTKIATLEADSAQQESAKVKAKNIIKNIDKFFSE